MEKYQIDFYKDSQLSPDEEGLRRKNQRGIWLFGGWIEAPNKHAACAQFRKDSQNPYGYKLRATEV